MNAEGCAWGCLPALDNTKCYDIMLPTVLIIRVLE